MVIIDSVLLLIEAQGLTFNGRSLLWYSLVVARGERTRRQTTPTQSLSNYRESVSLWFRTEENNGILFIIGRSTGEHLMIRVMISTCTYVLGNVIKMENSLLTIFSEIWPMTLYYSTGTLARFLSNFKNS